MASRQSLPGPALRSDSDEHPSITPVINSASDGLWLLETQGCCLVVGSVPDALIPSAVCRRPHRVHRAVAAATALPALCLTIHFNPRSASDHSLPLAWRPSSSSCALPGPCPSVSVLSTRSDLGTWFWFVVGPPRPPSLSGAAARAGLPWGNAHGQGGGLTHTAPVTPVGHTADGSPRGRTSLVSLLSGPRGSGRDSPCWSPRPASPPDGLPLRTPSVDTAPAARNSRGGISSFLCHSVLCFQRVCQG